MMKRKLGRSGQEVLQTEKKVDATDVDDDDPLPQPSKMMSSRQLQICVVKDCQCRKHLLLLN